MEKFIIESNHFKLKKLEVAPRELFRKSKVFLDGEELILQDGKALVLDDTGNEQAIRIAGPLSENFWIEVSEEKFFPQGILTGTDRVFVLLPLAFLSLGGAVGGGLGALACYTNSILVREYKNSNFIKYGLCLTTTFFAFISLIIVSLLTHLRMVI